jgi:diguanylate cyclase (GGDEF)-like protein
MSASDAQSTTRLAAALNAVGDVVDARELGGEPERQRGRFASFLNHDELTGHFDKTRLRETVDQIIAINLRTVAPAAFLAIGVDNMKTINDMFGADAADTVLIEVGRRLDCCLRVSDLVGRLDGDRFGIVLSHCPAPHATATAEKILSTVRLSPIATPRGAIFATVSIGGAAFPDQGSTSHAVITRAETALAEAKQAGRDCYRAYRSTEEQRERQNWGRSIGDQVRDALRQDRVMFAFQPIVSAATGAVDYHEALIHIRDNDGRVISAGEFVPIVEELGFIRLVDRYVLDRTVEEVARHPGITLGFNISGLTAADRPWLRSLISQVRARPEIASRLVVEITETAALYDIEESARFVAALRQAGCRVALDDFGAGHTSLKHLQSLPVDTVKIAGSFITNIAASPSGLAFLRHLVQLAQGFGLSTVAEGVENAADAAVLRREGVGYLQGFYYGRPSFDRPWVQPARLQSALPA